jgi:hypothetical protein
VSFRRRLDMGPGKPMHDVPHRAARDVEAAHEFGLSGLATFIGTPKFTHIGFSQERMAAPFAPRDTLRLGVRTVTFTTRYALGMRTGQVAFASGGVRQYAPREFWPPHRSPLGLAVGGIFRPSAKEKVRGIHARAHVAMVQNAQAIGDRAVDQLPRYPVRALMAEPTGTSKSSVPAGQRASRPQPAPIGLVDLWPEAFSDGRSVTGRGHFRARDFTPAGVLP